MTLPLIYIDQNVIGLQQSGRLRLTKRDDLQWVYSKEHFSELERSSNAEKYLAELARIDAKLLELQLNDSWKITGTARLIERGTPDSHYSNYLKARDDVPFNDALFDPFVAWLNGGGDEGLFRQFPDTLAEQVLKLIEAFPCGDLEEHVTSLGPQLRDAVEQMAAYGNDINDTRQALGIDKGRAGTIAGEDELKQLWKIIGAACAGITCDQFLGFDPRDKQGYEEWPLYLGIVGCCSVLDIVGFQAEKKCRKIDMIPNVRSDSGHIAMGAFCSALLSEDRRLVRRANAIYRYRNIGTTVLLLNSVHRDAAEDQPAQTLLSSSPDKRR